MKTEKEPVSRTCLKSFNQVLADVRRVSSPVPRGSTEARPEYQLET